MTTSPKKVKKNREERECIMKSRNKSVCYKSGMLIGHCIQVFLISVGIIYAVLLSVMTLSQDFRNQVIFLNWFNVPLFANFSSPQNYGLKNTENIYLAGEEGKIGAWYAKPSEAETCSPAYFLYLHGNGGNRAVGHRVELFKKLQNDCNYVLAIDYRGYGDSDGIPSEEGLIADSQVAWLWLAEKAGSQPVYIWGHSLGSAVAVGLGTRLANDPRLSGIILEAPFNNVRDVALRHPFSLLVKMIPEEWILNYLLKGVSSSFPSDKRIEKLTSPILIVHDKSDEIIPVELAEELCDVAKINKANVTCEIFDERLYHKFIYTSDNFFATLRSFLRSTRNGMQQ